MLTAIIAGIVIGLLSGARAVLELVNNLSEKGISVSLYHVSEGVKSFLSKAGMETALLRE